jgi:hypothetical protein
MPRSMPSMRAWSVSISASWLIGLTYVILGDRRGLVKPY